MASAAAVGANAAESPPLNDIGEDGGNIGEVTGAIGRKEDGIAAGQFAEEDDVRANGRRKGVADEEEHMGIEDEDLFGDEAEDMDAEKPA